MRDQYLRRKVRVCNWQNQIRQRCRFCKLAFEKAEELSLKLCRSVFLQKPACRFYRIFEHCKIFQFEMNNQPENGRSSTNLRVLFGDQFKAPFSHSSAVSHSWFKNKIGDLIRQHHPVIGIGIVRQLIRNSRISAARANPPGTFWVSRCISIPYSGLQPDFR